MTTFRQAIRHVMTPKRAQVVLQNAAVGNKVLTDVRAEEHYVQDDALWPAGYLGIPLGSHNTRDERSIEVTQDALTAFGELWQVVFDGSVPYYKSFMGRRPRDIRKILVQEALRFQTEQAWAWKRPRENTWRQSGKPWREAGPKEHSPERLPGLPAKPKVSSPSRSASQGRSAWK